MPTRHAARFTRSTLRARRRLGAGLVPLAAALALAGCASSPSRRSGVAMQAPVNASSGCFAPQPNLRAAYNRDYTVLGHSYAPLRNASGYDVDGTASWYGWESGKTTSMGTYFNPRAFTAASRVLPLPTCVEVTNLRNGRSALVLVNDRGPFVDSRVMDLSYGAAKALGVTTSGTAPVRIVALQDLPADATPAQASSAPDATPGPALDAAPGTAPASAPAPAVAPPDDTIQVRTLAPLTPAPLAPAPSTGGGDAERGLDALIARAEATPAAPAAPASTASTAAAADATATATAASDARAAVAPRSVQRVQSYLQTGAFTSRERALAERDRLRGAGVAAVDIVPGMVRGETFYRVQIGPLAADHPDPGLIARLASIGLRDYALVQQ